MVVVPSVDGRKVMKQDQKRDESRYISHDHADRGDHEIGAVTHLALEILYQDLPVDPAVKTESSSRLSVVFRYHILIHLFSLFLKASGNAQSFLLYLPEMHDRSSQPPLTVIFLTE